MHSERTKYSKSSLVDICLEKLHTIHSLAPHIKPIAFREHFSTRLYFLSVYIQYPICHYVITLL